MPPASSIRTLRSFGLLVGGIFALLGIWPVVLRRGEPRLWALIPAAALVGPALVYPRALGPVHRAWMAVGHILGWINTRIILGLAFYLVFTPVGFALRWLGKDPMRRRPDAGATTYRQNRTPRPASHMRNQF